MKMIQPNFEKSFEGWRKEARRLLQLAVLPENINWNEESPTLFLDPLPEHHPTQKAEPTKSPALPLKVPAEFISLAENISYARDADRWSLLYRILFRLQENPNLLKISIDPDIHRAQLLLKSVRRDIHKMHAFVRFKKTTLANEEAYLAWHKPEHLIVKPATPFFARRFGDRRWSIFTPDESAHWDLDHLTLGLA